MKQEFQPGDRVVCVVADRSNHTGDRHIGQVGTVIKHYEDLNRYAVEHDEMFVSWLHDCQGKVSPGKGWFYNCHELELMSDSPVVDDLL